MAIDVDLDFNDLEGPDAAGAPSGTWRAALVALVVVGVLLVAVAVEAFVQYRRLLASTTLESHTLEVLNRLDGLFASVLDAQNARRGYVIAGDLSLLPRFDRAVVQAS